MRTLKRLAMKNTPLTYLYAAGACVLMTAPLVCMWLLLYAIGGPNA